MIIIFYNWGRWSIRLIHGSIILCLLFLFTFVSWLPFPESETPHVFYKQRWILIILCRRSNRLIYWWPSKSIINEVLPKSSLSTPEHQSRAVSEQEHFLKHKTRAPSREKTLSTERASSKHVLESITITYWQGTTTKNLWQYILLIGKSG